MFDSIAPPHPDLALELPADAYWHLMRTLRLTLPPPPGDAPEALVRRDRAALARIAALAPVNAAEAELAAQFVAASEQWKDCLRLAQQPEAAPETAMKCRAQAASMMRQANAAVRLLLRMQQLRTKLEADPAAADRAAWSEHRAIRLMAEALSPTVAAPRVPEPEPEQVAVGARTPALAPREREQKPSPLGRGLAEGAFPHPAPGAGVDLLQARMAGRSPGSAYPLIVSTGDPPSRRLA